MSNRPLSHIRVLDFGHYLAGPMVGMMLADMGAEVIRIDPPAGPRWHDPVFDMLSRGKQALTLDLKAEAGLRTALALAARADVVIDNFRPRVMERLCLGPEALQAAHPGIISLSLPGFASTNPDLSGLVAWEAVIAARTGQFTDMGLNRQLMGINPSFTPLGLASAYGAAFGGMSVLFALTARKGGDHIEVPLASALFEGLAFSCEQIEDYPDRYKSPRGAELERRAKLGLPNNLTYAELGAFLDPFYRTYRGADGRVLCGVLFDQDPSAPGADGAWSGRTGGQSAGFRRLSGSGGLASALGDAQLSGGACRPRPRGRCDAGRLFDPPAVGMGRPDRCRQSPRDGAAQHARVAGGPTRLGLGVGVDGG